MQDAETEAGFPGACGRCNVAVSQVDSLLRRWIMEQLVGEFQSSGCLHERSEEVGEEITVIVNSSREQWKGTWDAYCGRRSEMGDFDEWTVSVTRTHAERREELYELEVRTGDQWAMLVAPVRMPLYHARNPKWEEEDLHPIWTELNVTDPEEGGQEG